MTQLNKTEKNTSDHPPETKTKTLTKKLLDSFNKIFDKAQSKTNTTEQNQSKEKTSSTQKDTLNENANERSFQLDQNENHFKHFFPELGISQTQHIEKIIITITQSIEKTLSTPTNETFFIALATHKHPFQIDLKKTNNQLAIKLTCDPTLHQLLTQYLPELKSYLRKKSINVKDIELEIDEELTRNSSQNKKNDPEKKINI